MAAQFGDYPVRVKTFVKTPQSRAKASLLLDTI